MTFRLKETVYTKKGRKKTWVEPGTYELVRLLARNRALINISQSADLRLLAIVPIALGEISFTD